MNTPNDEFDAIAKAIESGDINALDKIMASEEEIQNTEPEAEPTDSAEPAVPGDDATDDNPPVTSEDSPSDDVVADGEKTDPVATEVPSDKTEAATPAASPANETEDLKRELQRYKSDAGRVPFIQRRMAELERELRAYKARDTQPTQSGNLPKVTADGVELDDETKKQIEELREVDPVMAKAMERIAKTAIAGAKAQVDHAFTSYTQAEQEEDTDRFLMEQNYVLLQEIPTAHEIFATPQWSQWKNTLTPGQRAMAESSYAADVKQAIYAFAAAMQVAESGQPAQPAVPQQPAPVVATPVSTEASDKIKEARNRKVATSAEVKTASAKKSVELDEEQYFREMYDKVGKENHLFK